MWATMAQCGGEHGPWGATAAGDRPSYTVFYLANNLDPATEAIEADFPVLVMRKQYEPDTAGPGYNRGGAAVVKDTLWTEPAGHVSSPLHVKQPAGVGVYGGKDGGRGAVWVFEPGEGGSAPGRDGLVGTGTEVYERAEPVAACSTPGPTRSHRAVSTSSSPATRCGIRSRTRSSAT